MSYFNSLGENATVPDILAIEPVMSIALTHLTQTVMRGPSPLPEGMRELIATYVSGLNQCRYCTGVHRACAIAYGYSQEKLDAMQDNLDTCGLPQREIVLLRVAGRLTQTPSAMHEDLACAVFDAGWDERALHDTISVVGVFNLYNRFLEGHNVQGNQAMYAERGPMLKEHGYTPIIRVLERKITN